MVNARPEMKRSAPVSSRRDIVENTRAAPIRDTPIRPSRLELLALRASHYTRRLELLGLPDLSYCPAVLEDRNSAIYNATSLRRAGETKFILHRAESDSQESRALIITN